MLLQLEVAAPSPGFEQMRPRAAARQRPGNSLVVDRNAHEISEVARMRAGARHQLDPAPPATSAILTCTAPPSGGWSGAAVAALRSGALLSRGDGRIGGEAQPDASALAVDFDDAHGDLVALAEELLDGRGALAGRYV